MTMADVEVLTEYWIDHPPAHLLMAGRRASGSQPDLATLLGVDPNGEGVQPIRLH
jgi:hypothetical protein